MPRRVLRFVGRAPGAPAAPGPLLLEGEPLEPGERLVLERRRSPWDPSRSIQRVIVGSHPTRADVRLEGEGIHAEHLRVYHGGEADSPDDLRALLERSVRIQGEVLEHLEFRPIVPGDEIALADWLFVFEKEPDEPRSETPRSP